MSAFSTDALLDAARFGEADELSAQLDAAGRNAALIAAVRDEAGSTALHMAAGNGHAACVQLLLQCWPPAAIDAANDAGNTPLHWAALNGHAAVVRLLCDAGANVEVTAVAPLAPPGRDAVRPDRGCAAAQRQRKEPHLQRHGAR